MNLEDVKSNVSSRLTGAKSNLAVITMATVSGEVGGRGYGPPLTQDVRLSILGAIGTR